MHGFLQKRNAFMAGEREFKCPKCGFREYELDKISATGGGFSKIFDIQNKKFMTVSCKQCGYTEMYKRSTSQMGNILDFFTS